MGNRWFLWRALLAMASLLLLSGCFEVRQRLTVYEGGEAEMTLTVVISEELAEWSDDDDEHSADCAEGFGFDGELPPSLKKTKNVRREDGNVLCDWQVTGPLDDMIPVLEAYNETQGDDDFVLIQSLGEGRYTLIGQYDFRDDSVGINDDMGPFGRAIEGAIGATLGDAEISWQVSVPQVLETNGEQTRDGAVTWAFPLADAVTTGGVYTFEVIFETEGKSRLF